MLAVVVALASAPVYAHRMDERYGAFLGSFLHPLTSLDHGLAFVALGLLAGQQCRAVASRLIVTFVLGLLIGALLPLSAIAGGSIAHLTTVNIASVVVLGGLVALARPLSLPLFVALAGLFGLSHGLENVSDAAVELKSLKSVAGVVTAGLVASALFAVLAAIMQTQAAWLRVAVRVIGSWAAAIGLIMLGFQLR
ncbi:MAG: HupE/UreJ family protein [Gammaproteobacteria bacterium]